MDKTHIWQGKGWTVEVLFSRAGLSNSILVLLDSGVSFLLDCGDGTLRDLIELHDRKGLDLNKIAAICLTHGHFDHVGGLHGLLGFLRMIGRNATLKILTPEGSSQDGLIIEAFRTAYKDSIPFDIERIGIEDKASIEMEGISITTFRVIHCGSTQHGGIGKPLSALGYVLCHDEERVVYTGDCGLDSGIESYIKDADLLLIEATLKEPGGEMERKVHLSLESAMQFALLAKTAFVIHRGGNQPILKIEPEINR